MSNGLFDAQPGVKGAVNQCRKSPAEPIKSEPCKHQQLEIKCGHARSIYISETVPLYAQIPLEVCAGPDSVTDEIQCTTNVLEGPCPIHRDKVFDLDSDPPPLEDIKSQTDTNLSFAAHSATFGDDFLEFIWPSNPQNRWYHVRTNTCYGQFLSGNVKVYPDIQWSAGVSLKWVKKGQSKPGKTTVDGVKGVKETAKESGFVFGGFLQYKYDGETHKISGEFEKRATRTFTVLNTAARSFKQISKSISELGSTEFNWDFPALKKLSGSWGWKEHPSEPHCCYTFDVSFDLLIIGGSFTVSVEKAIIEVITSGAATVITKALKKLEESGNELSIKLIVSGQLGLTGKWIYKVSDHGKDLPPTPIKAELGFDITLKGTAKIELDVFFFSISASAESGITTGFKGSASALTRNRKAILNWTLDWNGLVFFAKLKGPSADVKKSTSKQKKSNAKKNKGKLKSKVDTSEGEVSSSYDYTKVLASPRTLAEGEYVLIDNS